MNKNISVIIPTYNRVEALQRTLKCIQNADDRPEEIIVVDQTDNSEQIQQIKKICSECEMNVIYVHQDCPSLTKARNRGIELAQNEIILFMDDDVDVAKDTFVSLRDLFSNPLIAMAGGVDKTPVSHNSVLGYFFGKASYSKRKIGHVTKAIYGRFPLVCKEQTPTEWAMGFFFAVRRSCILRWNLRFDEKLQYYAYAEDLDFSYGFYLNAKRENLKCIMSNKLIVNHRVSNEYRLPTKKATYMVILHREYIRHKYFARNIGTYILCLWSDIGDLIYRIIHKQNTCDIIRARSFFYKHYSDILHGNFHYLDFMH